MRRSAQVLLAMLVASSWQPATAGAAVEWHGPTTVDSTRGGWPAVAVDGAGNAAVVYETARRRWGRRLELAVRRAGGRFRHVGAVGTGTERPQVVASPAGALAIVGWRERGLSVSLIPAPGPAAGDGALAQMRSFDFPLAPGRVGRTVSVGIDAAGEATVAWSVAPRDRPDEQGPDRVYVATVGERGTGGASELLVGAHACFPLVDVNLRGDAVLAPRCLGRQEDVLYRPAGGRFGVGEEVQGFPATGATDAMIDGDGAVVAWQTFAGGVKRPSYRTRFALRPPGGAFAPARELDTGAPNVSMSSQENGRTVAAWSQGDVRYAIHTRRDGWGPQRTIDTPFPLVADVTVVPSWHGPVLLHWGYFPLDGDRSLLRRADVAVLDGDGRPGRRQAIRASRRVDDRMALSAAIDDSGRAVAAWADRCHGRHGAFGVVSAVVRDRRSRAVSGRCPDRTPPRVRRVASHARLVGRRVRLRLRCGEACRLRARWRIASPDGRRLARGGARARLPARRGASVGLRLSRREARRVRRALTHGPGARLRLALTAVDAAGNRRAARLWLPLRTAGARPRSAAILATCMPGTHTKRTPCR